MKKIAFLMLIVMALFVLGVNGCAKETVATGNQAVAMSFVENAPPSTVAVNQEFPIYVDIINRGGSYLNAGEAKFYLSGVGPGFQGITQSLVNLNFLSKESTIPERLSFAAKAKYTSDLQSPLQQNLVLTTCYNYGIVAQANICVSNINSSVICTLSGEKITASSNSVSPIQITSVTETLEGTKLQVTILIENRGASSVQNFPNIYLQDTNCDKLYAHDFNEMQKEKKLNVLVNIGAESGWKCKVQSSVSPYPAISALEGIISLEPIGKLVCEKNVKDEQSHSMPLTISLHYRYVDAIIKSIQIMPA